jgi:hypothetical protein
MRIKGIDPESPPESLKAAFEKQVELFGHVLTPNLAMAHRPEIVRAVGKLGQAIGASQVVDSRLKLMVSIHAAQMIGCPF